MRIKPLLWCSLIGALPAVAISGNLDSPAAPTDSASGMYSITDLYNRLDTGAAGSKRTGSFTEPSSGPTSGTTPTLDEVMGKAPVVDSSGAIPSDVLSGAPFWGLSSGGWGVQTGTMPINNGDNPSTGETLSGEQIKLTVPAGYYDGDDTVTVTLDEIAALLPNLQSKIKCGYSVLGVSGKCAYTIPRTGQTTCYAADYSITDCSNTVGQDGNNLSGVAWPNPRFTDNGDGTVTDNLTDLIWLKNTNCDGKKLWEDAMAFASSLADSQCGLTDGSSAGDWRVPNINELRSLMSAGQSNPAVPDTLGTGAWSAGDPFTSLQFSSSSSDEAFYWSSTSSMASPNHAQVIDYYQGTVTNEPKIDIAIDLSFIPAAELYVWPVRGGQ